MAVIPGTFKLPTNYLSVISREGSVYFLLLDFFPLDYVVIYSDTFRD